MIKILLIILIFSFNFVAYAQNGYDTYEVDSFIDEMYQKHNYSKKDLKELFSKIKEEKKLKRFFKKAPER